jgi:ATP-dependent helicase HrpA
LPRTGDDFLALATKVKGDWFVAATAVGKVLDLLVSEVPQLRDWCARQASSRYLAAVADDINEQLDWLMRRQFCWHTGFTMLSEYPRYLRAIRMRIDRLDSLPIAKDLEKMDRVRDLWEPWFDAWHRDSQNPVLWSMGWMLEEYRISLFAPGVPVKGTISEKKLRQMWEGMK